MTANESPDKLDRLELDRLRDELWAAHRRFLALSGKIEPGSKEDGQFLALAIAGEAREVANLVKKEWRGDEPDFENLIDELGDVFVYWFLLCLVRGQEVTRVVANAVQKMHRRIEELETQRAAEARTRRRAGSDELSRAELTRALPRILGCGHGVSCRRRDEWCCRVREMLTEDGFLSPPEVQA